jgi:hypothetical protein
MKSGFKYGASNRRWGWEAVGWVAISWGSGSQHRRIPYRIFRVFFSFDERLLHERAN